MRRVCFAILAILPLGMPTAFGSEKMPWETNSPIVEVRRELYRKHPRPKTAAMVGVRYMGPNMVREESWSTMSKSDTPEQPTRRCSADNGQTWSEFESQPETVTHPQGIRVFWGIGSKVYDPTSKATVSTWLRQTHRDDVYYNQIFSRFSYDDGRTWSDGVQLGYEPGMKFDPSDPFNADFLNNNQAYFGNNIIRHSNGTLITSAASVNIPTGVPIPNPKRLSVMGIPADARNIGSVCFVGQWDPRKQAYNWSAGEPVWLSRSITSRGLLEPEVAELKDGRVLVVWRGSNAVLDPMLVPGRKWFSVSSDGGKTLSQPTDWRYDDGSQFYSPSSFHRMIRHSVTGKLYWIGNLCAGRTRGNSPRFPLVIAEVDENGPALMKDTVTLIDGRDTKDGSQLQLSNFSLLEDRETHEIELYLTRLGENAKDFWGANAYKYTLHLK
jgi:hypothetical protein